MKQLVDLAFTFFKIGFFTFGGGYAMLPMIQKMVVEKKEWLSEDELVDLFILSQSTPGVIAVNTATFIGYRKRGTPGALFATAGVILPSLIIIILIAALLSGLGSNPYLVSALQGIRIVAVLLIIKFMLRMAKRSITGIIPLALALVSFVAITFIQISPIAILAASALFGILFSHLWTSS